MTFVVKTDRHIYITLNLKKDNTYKYISHSISWDGQSVLDSGTYQLKDNIVVFSSKYTQSKDNFADKKYYMKVRRVKHYETDYVYNIIYCKKKTLFGKRIIALLKNPNDSIVLTSKRPKDHIRVKALTPDTSIKQWVYTNIFPIYQYNINDLDSTNWKSVFESKRLHILSVKSVFGLTMGVYFLIDDNVYYTNYPSTIKFNKPLIDKCYNEHLITSKQKKQIIKTIEEFEKTGWTKN